MEDLAGRQDGLEIPQEFDINPTARGFTMRGWDFSRAQIARAVRDRVLLNPAFELGTNSCPWNCDFCFSEDPKHPTKRRLVGEMSLRDRLRLVDQAADLGALTINWVGAGEPTIDPDFWTILERIVSRGIVPIVYTEGTLRLSRPKFSKRLFDLGATVVLKVNSLADHAYQNRIVAGSAQTKTAAADYSVRRNRVIDLLLELGFADSTPTRLAFDTIITKQNLKEVTDIHRYARVNNIFVMFVNYLPAGRSVDGREDAISRQQTLDVFDQIERIDRQEFGFTHRTDFPYAGGVPCTIRGLGLFTKITGEVFDCPGQLMSLGNLKTQSLESIWERARAITKSFDGKCLPRQLAWERQARSALKDPHVVKRILESYG
ncbi:MAG TPA: radical SAM protein [Pyrinomonadaceae bacterium]|nr:radical SAM protein [Pyrinomonadaceae bacterium]